MTTECDLLVIGGGPAGLCAAINAASEGLKTCLLDASMTLGGQARESNAIENYPLPLGHTGGVTGSELMSGFIEQANKFGAQMHLPAKVARLSVNGDRKIVTTEDYETFASRAVILSLGVSYRRHSAPGISRLMGRGVFYGLPYGTVGLTNKTVGVVGGANSAGQAVLKLAQNSKCQVKMFVRRKLEDSMSAYLIDRIRNCPNVEVLEGTEIHEAGGEAKLVGVTVQSDGKLFSLLLDHLYIFIGAVPKTAWLEPCAVKLSDKKFVLTDVDLNRERLPFETSVDGVFACGDVRQGSVKRVSAAVGEGSGAVSMVHRYLAR